MPFTALGLAMVCGAAFCLALLCGEALLALVCGAAFGLALLFGEAFSALVCGAAFGLALLCGEAFCAVKAFGAELRFPSRMVPCDVGIDDGVTRLRSVDLDFFFVLVW